MTDNIRSQTLPGVGKNYNDSDTVKPEQYRTIWISDIHLGTPGCKTAFLLDFLKNNESEYLYLVGDIIDGWRLKKSWYWVQSHNDVIQKILRKARKGTIVTYIAGNHDELLRNFLNISLGNITILDEVIHTTVDGKKLWVTHGDQYDGILKNARWIAIFGDVLYNFLIKVNGFFNRIRRLLGFSYWSLSQYLKHKVKNAVNFITEFETVLLNETKNRGLDGIVCGHIHKAEIKEIDGLLYCNDGDWVESLTALVEDFDGNLKLVHWPYDGSAESPNADIKITPDVESLA